MRTSVQAMDCCMTFRRSFRATRESAGTPRASAASSTLDHSVEAHETATDGGADRRGAARDAQLLVEMRDVDLDGPLADGQRVSDCPVGFARRQETQDVHLARRELHACQ